MRTGHTSNPRHRRVFQHHKPSAPFCRLRNLALLAFVGMMLSLYFLAAMHGGPSAGPGASSELASSSTKNKAVVAASIQEDEYRQDPPFHVAFSTSCNAFQDWQSLLLFLTADMVGQPGPVTRIASGCTAKEEAQLRNVYSRLDKGRNKFRLHVTPDFSIDAASGDKYYFYNKPGGLQHWLESAASPPDDAVVALIDPDFIFMRPLTAKIKEDGIIYSGAVEAADLFEAVTQGHPVAQFYGIGDKWTEFNLTYIAGDDSPALAVKSGPAWTHYSIGPPYIVQKTDMARIAKVWHSIVPRVYEGHPHLLAEMYAYSVAAAHLELPHLRLDGYMTSETQSYGEAWSLVDDLPEENLCTEDLSARTTRLPTFLHYCQRYKVGPEYNFWKRDLNEQFFSCGGEALAIPTAQEVRDFLDPPTGPLPAKDRANHKYHVFQYCQVAIKTNKALQQYQGLMCNHGDAAAVPKEAVNT